jgi:exodeoxyribonuclease VII small subunit
VAAEGEGDRSTEAGDGLSLEARLRRLEEIVTSLETDGVELDRALSLFEEGVGHLRRAERMLAEAELRVEELIGRGETLGTRDLHREDG